MNTDLLMTLFIALAVLSYIRYLNHMVASIRFKVNLTEKRDKLLSLIHSGKISKQNHTANTMLYSMERSIENHFFITLFGLYVKALRFRKEIEKHQIVLKYSEDLVKYPELNKLNADYTAIILQYVKEQHFVTFYCFIFPFVFFGFGLVQAKKTLVEYLKGVVLIGDDTKALQLMAV